MTYIQGHRRGKPYDERLGLNEDYVGNERCDQLTQVEIEKVVSPASLDRFYLENGRPPASLDELVGEGKFIKRLVAMDG